MPVTFRVDDELVEKIRDAAYWERRSVKDVVSSALKEYLACLVKDRGKEYPPRKGPLPRGPRLVQSDDNGGKT
jgi:hypothetical protein